MASAAAAPFIFRLNIKIFSIRHQTDPHLESLAVVTSLPESAGLFLTSACSFGRLCHGGLALVTRNGKQHLALSLNALAPLLRRSGCGFFLCNATAECVHDVRNILRPRRGMLARYRHAGLFLLEHLDHGLFIMVDELCWVEVSRLALEDVLGELEHIRLSFHVRDVVEIFFRVPNLVRIA